jgi:hypothetical protein
VVQSGAVLPAANAFGCEVNTPSRFVAAVNTDATGTIIVQTRGFGDAAIDGRALTIQPLNAAGAALTAASAAQTIASWRCTAAPANVGGGPIPARALPGSCR